MLVQIYMQLLHRSLSDVLGLVQICVLEFMLFDIIVKFGVVFHPVRVYMLWKFMISQCNSSENYTYPNSSQNLSLIQFSTRDDE